MPALTLAFDASGPAGPVDVAVSVDGVPVAQLHLDWSALQSPLEPEHYLDLARLLCRAKFGGMAPEVAADVFAQGVSL